MFGYVTVCEPELKVKRFKKNIRHIIAVCVMY